MTISRFFLRAMTAAILAAPLATLGAGLGHAQGLFFDWDGEKKQNGSGKEVVALKTDAKPGDVIVSFGDRKLYYITKPGEALSYPVAIPREQDRWQGVTRVSSKRENPPWRPTADMRKENPRLPTFVPGGHSMNPMGIRAMYLGESTYRIHGTDAPWTIGTAVSKGCIRMYNQDVLDLYPRVKIGAKVTVTWQKFRTEPGAPGVATVSAVGPDAKPVVGVKQKSSETSKQQVAKASKGGDQRQASVEDDKKPTRQASRAVTRKARKPETPAAKPAEKREEISI